ncbi:hypothetical protein SAMN05421743_104206 [Thalassobacillus cyri]|uniref:Uncharacterized protein n=1 Tax=Thalassobacillus cyri TaxID=571932 RepID=A0A1H4AUE0_9BACI|nr:DUF6470 family protein [Thalassobacillus cyri]SEA39523.1 hypothetical protein SAMN05421743_104206 [Thalassobacillus cyri]
MDFPQIRLSSQRAAIKIETQQATQSIEQPKAQQSIQQPKADVSMRQRPGKLTIDQTNAWHNLGLKSSQVRTRETADHARKSLLEGIARTSQKGDELMRIEQGGNPLADQATRNAVWNFEYKPGGMPAYDLVALDYQAQRPEINITRNTPVINAVPQKVRHDYKPGKVDVSMDKYASLNIDFVNLTYKGYRFEIEI